MEKITLFDDLLVLSEPLPHDRRGQHCTLMGCDHEGISGELIYWVPHPRQRYWACSMDCLQKWKKGHKDYYS